MTEGDGRDLCWKSVLEQMARACSFVWRSNTEFRTGQRTIGDYITYCATH